MDIKYKIKIVLSLPNTIYFNFKCFPLKEAIRLPVLIGYRTRFGELYPNIKLDYLCPRFGIKLGWGGTGSRDWGRKSYVSIGSKGCIIFHGKCTMASGVSLIVDKGILEMGENFYCNKNCSISCNSTITIGDGNMWGWNVEILDSDNHYLTHSKRLENKDKEPIVIGNHVWIAAFSHILKGAEIRDGSVVAYGSIISKKFHKECLLVGGMPNRILAENTVWRSETI